MQETYNLMVYITQLII